MPPIQDFPLLPDPLRWALQQRAYIFDQAHKALLEKFDHAVHLAGPKRLDPNDMASDGFHPGPAIYREWGLLAADLVTREWNSRQSH